MKKNTTNPTSTEKDLPVEPTAVSAWTKKRMIYIELTDGRIIGFPAVVEHHLTLGAGYQFSERLSIHAGYVRAFEKSVSQKGTDLYGMPVELESTLSEDSIEFGLSYRF